MQVDKLLLLRIVILAQAGATSAYGYDLCFGSCSAATWWRLTLSLVATCVIWGLVQIRTGNPMFINIQGLWLAAQVRLFILIAVVAIPGVEITDGSCRDQFTADKLRVALLILSWDALGIQTIYHWARDACPPRMLVDGR